MCGNIACAVNTLENEADIPVIWRADELSKLEGPKAGHPGLRQQQERHERPLQGQLGLDVGESCVVEYDDECDERDYCVPEDESATAKGDYVSLVDNPERFTGYSGPSPRQVWDAIYRENCFSRDLTTDRAGSNMPSTPEREASSALKNVMKEHGRQQALARGTEKGLASDGFVLDDECLEKRVFYRIISGMHASISTHLCWDHLNQTTGEWGPNLQCYEEKLHRHPERVSNLYFDYALVLRAVAKLGGYLENYTFCSGDVVQDRITKKKVLGLADKAASGPTIFDESLMFQDGAAAGLKEDFRNRFRNVSRLMDCVGCDKCRLWGKLQTAGYGTALKVLFEFDDSEKPDAQLRRTELVALINTLDRISTSITSVSKFRQTIADRDQESDGAGGLEDDMDDDEGFACAHEWAQAESDRRSQSFTITAIFWEEWYRLWRTFAHVLRSWYQIPKTMYVDDPSLDHADIARGTIMVLEVGRVWDFWLGLPVPPRAWEIRRATHDDL